MKLTIQYPSDPAAAQRLREEVARQYAAALFQAVQELPCPLEQKQALLRRAIAEHQEKP